MVSLAIWVAATLFLGCVGLVLFALGIAAVEGVLGRVADRLPKGGPTLADCNRMGPYKRKP